MNPSHTRARSKLMIVRPTLGQGGGDRVTLILLEHLDRERFDPVLVLMRAEGEFLEDVPADVDVHVLGARSLWTMAGKLSKLFRREQPDIVFGLCGGASMPAVLAHKLARSKARLIVAERGVLHRGRGLKRKLSVQVRKRLFPFADHAIAISQGVRDELISVLGLQPDHVSVVPSPVDEHAIRKQAQEPSEHPWFGTEIPVVMTAARFIPEKDLPTLLAAIARLRQVRPVRLVIFGEGPLQGELEAEAERLELDADTVDFAGFDKNPFRYMARCDVFVLSSRFEGLGSSLIQAMVAGAAVVATDYYVGASDIVTDGVDGYLVPVGDAEALADRIGHLLDHPEQREAFREASLVSTQRFTSARVVAQHEAVLLGDADPDSGTLAHSHQRTR